MTRFPLVSPALILVALSVTGCTDDNLEPDAVPCGIRVCSVDPDEGGPDWNDPENRGKADAVGVATAIAAATADGVWDAADVEAAFEAAGGRVGRQEMALIHQAVDSATFEVTPDAAAMARTLAARSNLFEHEVDDVLDGRSFGDHEIPAAVQDLVERARLAGAVAYDVTELDEDGEGVWSPYPSTTPPTDNMTFEYTEITPAVLQADIDDTAVVYNAIIGTETDEFCDGAGNCTEFQQARYVERTGGTGNVLAHYDEVFHPDVFARGSAGQKWANNCAILSDGSIHCLPAARRSVLQDLILTNPHISRCNDFAGFEDACKHMLYNGHIDIRDGVVVGVEVSGRLSKRAARGRAVFVDPLAVLEAWGFELAPGLRIRYGNTEDGVPVRDLDNGVMRSATP